MIGGKFKFPKSTTGNHARQRAGLDRSNPGRAKKSARSRYAPASLRHFEVTGMRRSLPSERWVMRGPGGD